MSEKAYPVTVDEVLDYLGIDYADAMVNNNILRAIKTADSYLIGSIGEGYPMDDPRAKELALIIISDLYDTRGLNEMVSVRTRRLVNDFSLQLRLELRRGLEENV
jgi:hypothetical protein